MGGRLSTRLGPARRARRSPAPRKRCSQARALRPHGVGLGAAYPAIRTTAGVAARRGVRVSRLVTGSGVRARGRSGADGLSGVRGRVPRGLALPRPQADQFRRRARRAPGAPRCLVHSHPASGGEAGRRGRSGRGGLRARAARSRHRAGVSWLMTSPAQDCSRPGFSAAAPVWRSVHVQLRSARDRAHLHEKRLCAAELQLLKGAARRGLSCTRANPRGVRALSGTHFFSRLEPLSAPPVARPGRHLLLPHPRCHELVVPVLVLQKSTGPHAHRRIHACQTVPVAVGAAPCLSPPLESPAATRAPRRTFDEQDPRSLSRSSRGA